MPIFISVKMHVSRKFVSQFPGENKSAKVDDCALRGLHCKISFVNTTMSDRRMFLDKCKHIFR